MWKVKKQIQTFNQGGRHWHCCHAVHGFLENKWINKVSRQTERHNCTMKVKVAQLCLTLWDPMDCSPPGSSLHRILQARILEWVAIPFSRGSSPPRDQNLFSRIAGGFFTIWATREANNYLVQLNKLKNFKPENYTSKYLFKCRKNI